jgi:hypothetical protein
VTAVQRGQIARLPKELARFLSLPGPQSLLIRGLPGTGKTSLAISLLQGFQGSRFLITGRVGPSEVARSFPEIASREGGGLRIVDGSSLADSLERASELVKHLREMVRHPDRDPSTQALWLPEAVQEVWSELTPGGPSMVVIDPWDALIERYLGTSPEPRAQPPTREAVERVLLWLFAQAPAHLVLLAERQEATHLDYLVNGVGVTSLGRTETGRLERQLLLPKLRGVRIENASYPFTLENAEFQCIEPLREGTAPVVGRPSPAPREDPALLWPGNPSFVEAFGWLPHGALTLYEVDPTVPEPIANLIPATLAISVLERGGRVVLTPSPTTLPSALWAEFKPVLDEDTVARGLRIISPAGTSGLPAALGRCVLGYDMDRGRGEGRALFERAIRFLQETPDGKDVLTLQVLRGIEPLLDQGDPPLTASSLVLQHVRGLWSKRVHGFLMADRGSPLTDKFRYLSTLQLMLREREGRIIVAGNVPRTHNFVLMMDPEAGPYRLLRVV